MFYSHREHDSNLMTTIRRRPRFLSKLNFIFSALKFWRAECQVAVRADVLTTGTLF